MSKIKKALIAIILFAFDVYIGGGKIGLIFAAELKNQTENKANVENQNMIDFRGEIIAASKKIEPADAPYDDCNFTLKIQDAKGSVFLVVAPLFEKKILTRYSDWKVGDHVSIGMLPENAVSEDVKSRQLQDDLNDMESDVYYLTEGKLLENENSQNDFFRNDYDEFIKAELQNVEKLIARHDANIEANRENISKSLAGLKEKMRDGAYGVNEEDGFFFLFSSANNINIEGKYNETVLRSFIDLDKKCKKYGCRLLVIPAIPSKCHALTRLIPFFRETGFSDYGRETLVRDLLKNGIPAIDTQSFLNGIVSQDKISYTFNSTTDGHFSSTTNALLADRVASLLLKKKEYEYSFNKGYFTLMSPFFQFYKGKAQVDFSPKFARKPTVNENAKGILIVGDSFVTTNGFNQYLQSMCPVPVATFNRGAGANMQMREVMLGKKDEELKKTSILIFIYFNSYSSHIWPTAASTYCEQHLNEGKLVSVKPNKEKDLVIPYPADFGDQAIVLLELPALTGTYSISNHGKKVFAYDSEFKYGSNTPLAIPVNKTECVNGNIVLSFDIVPTIKSIRLFNKSKSLIP